MNKRKSYHLFFLLPHVEGEPNFYDINNQCPIPSRPNHSSNHNKQHHHMVMLPSVGTGSAAAGAPGLYGVYPARNQQSMWHQNNLNPNFFPFYQGAIYPPPPPYHHGHHFSEPSSLSVTALPPTTQQMGGGSGFMFPSYSYTDLNPSSYHDDAHPQTLSAVNYDFQSSNGAVAAVSNKNDDDSLSHNMENLEYHVE